MSSTTGSRHNCEQGQGYSPPQQRNHRGGGERHHHRPHPTGGAGGIPWGGGGEGGCGSPASCMLVLSICLSVCHAWMSGYVICMDVLFSNICAGECVYMCINGVSHRASRPGPTSGWSRLAAHGKA